MKEDNHDTKQVVLTSNVWKNSESDTINKSRTLDFYRNISLPLKLGSIV